MKRLKNSLEDLDEEISILKERLENETEARQANIKKHAELLKQSQRREATVLATAQKVAARLDQTINHVEQILRD